MTAPVYVYINTDGQKNQELFFYETMKQAHKKANKVIEEFYKTDEVAKETTKGYRIAECANYLSFKHYFLTDEYKLDRVNLCKDRLCLNCQLALSRKLIRQLIWTVEHLQMNQGDTLQFMTLTVPNVTAEELRSAIRTQIAATKSFLRKYHITDYFRSVEITYNKAEKTFHPHLHFLLIAPKGSKLPLFDKLKGKQGANALQFAWAEKWQEISGKTITDTISGNGRAYLEATIYKVRDRKSIFELTKYITKPEQITKPVVKAFYGLSFDQEGAKNTGLNHLRLKTPCGQFKELATRYKICAELEREAERQKYQDIDYELLEYLYSGKNYERVSRNENRR